MTVSPLQKYFADELRKAREDAGLSQEALATKMYISRGVIAMVETCQRLPRPDFAAAADEALGTDGRFDRMREALLQSEATPEWFRPWVDYEQHATSLRGYEPTVVPGLLQTEEYALALTSNADATAARMSRQKILAADSPPSLDYIIDESVLHRQIGSPEVMGEQLTGLAEGGVRVQVLPRDAESNLGVDGSFVLALVDDNDYVYVHTPARGFVVHDAAVLSAVRNRWDILRGEALPIRHSRELISKAADEWKNSA